MRAAAWLVIGVTCEDLDMGGTFDGGVALRINSRKVRFRRHFDSARPLKKFCFDLRLLWLHARSATPI